MEFTAVILEKIFRRKFVDKGVDFLSANVDRKKKMKEMTSNFLEMTSKKW